MEILLSWVRGREQLGQVPRFADVVDYAHKILGFRQLKKGDIVKRLRLTDTYLNNSRQQRKRFRGGKNRPVIVNNLGNLHCDIGFYSARREYETPVTYKAGFLVAKDVLSRFVYVSILYKTRTAPAMVKAFEDIIRQAEKNGTPVVSVAFDKERSVMSHLVQDFFRERNIKFHAFQMTSSKAKHAESAIRLLRTTVARLQAVPAFAGRKWWTLLQVAADSLNSLPVRVAGKNLGFSPKQINSSNLKDFLAALYRQVPSYFWAQFNISPSFVRSWAFEVGDVVRPKLIVTSSEVIGTKRSEVTLEEARYIVEKKIPYVSTAFTVERAYRCRSLEDGKTLEYFDESDIALSK